MFIAALFTIAKTCKQPKCPSTEEWIKKMWFIYIAEYYSAIKKSELMPFAATWMDLESVLLSEVSQRRRNSILRKQKETHRLRKRTYGCWWGGIVRDFGKVMYTLQHLK